MEKLAIKSGDQVLLFSRRDDEDVDYWMIDLRTETVVDEGTYDLEGPNELEEVATDVIEDYPEFAADVLDDIMSFSVDPSDYERYER